ncbi:MAG: twitching motility protein PilT [Chloroflexota bacterium]|nr:MAG: twitching motility protein PilT [Chloroflexota bacterium]
MPDMKSILVDTNLLVYAYDPRDKARNERAQQVLQRLRQSRRGVMSVQSLAEFMRASQKLAMSPDEALRIVQAFALSWPILDLTPALVLEAGRGVSQYMLAYYDAQVWAAARLNQIGVIFSEDFNPGSILEGVRTVNPFAEEFVIEAWT